MKKQFISTVGMVLAGLIYIVFAIEPNKVVTTTHNVDGAGYNLDGSGIDNVISMEYTDGFGRNIQSKLRIAANKDRASCIFYDKAGRPFITTKSFIDTKSVSKFLPGEISDPEIIGQLKACNFDDSRPYSETGYWDNPLGSGKYSLKPGDAYKIDSSRSWTLGVAISDISPYSVNRISGTIGYLRFKDGMMEQIVVTDETSGIEEVLDSVYSTFLKTNPFLAPTHLLTISLAYDDEPGSRTAYISEELKDKFGRTIKTLTSPAINSRPGEKIIACFHHDILGNVLIETPPKNGEFTLIENSEYRYNTLGQLIWKKVPDGGEFEYSYRDDGQINYVLSYVKSGEVKIKVRKIDYVYDNIGRLHYIQQYYFDDGGFSSTPHFLVSYYYDSKIELDSREVLSIIPMSYRDKLTNLKGRLVATVTSNYCGDKKINIGEIYSYDDEGRVKCKFITMSGSPLPQETWYTYDNHGKVLYEAFYYGGDHIMKRYNYDYLGRLLTVEHGRLNSGGDGYDYTLLVKMNYDDLGRTASKELSAISSGNYKALYGTDILDRVTDITYGKDLGLPSGAVKFSESIGTFDGSGNKLATGFTSGGNIKNVRYNYAVTTPQTFDYIYDYDDLDRLKASEKKQDGSTIENNTYGYDQAGRFTAKKEGGSDLTGYTYYNGTSRLRSTSKNSGDPGKAYIFDKHGNMVVDFTKNMVIEYDWRDLPVVFRFYNDISLAAIPKDDKGTYSDTTDLYAYVKAKDDDIPDLSLLSSVIMAYNADGNRVIKMDVKE